jgi:lysozyme
MNWFKEQLIKDQDIVTAGKAKEIAKGLGLGMGLGLAPMTLLPGINKAPASDQIKNIETVSPKVEEKPKPIFYHILKNPAENKKVIETPKSVQVHNHLAESGLSQDIKDMIKRHEGVRFTTYNDSRGIPTVGIGYNLQNSNAKRVLRSLGLDYDAVLAKRQSLNENQVNALFELSLTEAIKTAQDTFSSFNNQPEAIKGVLIDMSFNLGYKIRNFHNFINAINDHNYKRAAMEMKNSLWYGQVKSRASELMGIVSRSV